MSVYTPRTVTAREVDKTATLERHAQNTRKTNKDRKIKACTSSARCNCKHHRKRRKHRLKNILGRTILKKRAGLVPAHYFLWIAATVLITI